MQIILDNRLTISNPPPSFQAELRDRLTFPNPQHEEAEKQGRWTGDIERVIRGYRLTESGLIVPRGFAGHAIRLARRQGVPFRFDDRRRTLPPVDFTFNGTLRDFQEEAAAAMLTKDFGTLTAPTGSGKTVMALHLIAKRRQPALVVVHTRELLNQWADRIETFLEIPREEIGIIGGGKAKIGQKITVATVQSLVKCAGEVSPYIGHLIIDECHHAPSRTFTDVVTAFDSRFMTGLSATPWRRDGLSRLIFWHVGDVVHEIDRAELMETGNVLSFSVTMRETDFTTSFDPSAEYSRMLSELTEDPERNRLIADVVVEARAPGTALILTDRKNHAGALADLLEERGVHADVLTGDCTARTRREIVERLNRGEVRILIATGQLVGEGFDAAGLTTLFLATPIKFDGRLLQYLGRVLRPAPGKERAEVVDFVDGHVGVLKAAAWARQRVYARAGR